MSDELVTLEEDRVRATPESIHRRYELEMITDSLEESLSERSFVGLAGAIDRLQDWRTKYGETYEPFEGAIE